MKNLDLMIENAYDVIREKGLALVKLNVAYALVGNNSESIDRIFELKNRSYDKKCVILGTKEIISEIIEFDSKKGIDQLSYPVGLIAPVSKNYITQIPCRIIKDSTIATFINMGVIGDRLANLAFGEGELLYGSSGNSSGKGNNYKYNDVQNNIKLGVDFSYDFGDCEYQEFTEGRAMSATMIDLASGKITRKGLLEKEIRSEARKAGLLINGGK
jgi:tRNA A37 threonylcarbamoyladenosine synthetase subunit TsaC/SUA5/YrdC